MKIRGAEEQIAHRLDLQLQEHVFPHRLVGVIEIAAQVLAHLDLVESDLAAVKHVREVLCAPTSHRIARLPRSAAASANASETVDLPTPPLPVTKTSRLSSSAGGPTYNRFDFSQLWDALSRDGPPSQRSPRPRRR